MVPGPGQGGGSNYGLDMTTNDTLRVTDSRTGRSYELPIVDGAIRAIDLRQIKTSDDDFGLLAYDPAFQNTASCRSAITFIDGDKGILRYRGYPIEELASRASFLDVAWLLLRGWIPGVVKIELTDADDPTPYWLVSTRNPAALAAALNS